MVHLLPAEVSLTVLVVHTRVDRVVTGRERNIIQLPAAGDLSKSGSTREAVTGVHWFQRNVGASDVPSRK